MNPGPKPEDYTGNTYNRLTVQGLDHVKRSKRFYRCLCVCGRTCVVDISHLKSGNTKSCGCLMHEWSTSGKAPLKHGGAKGGHTVEYNAWAKMRQRCYNPKDHKYPNYGGRGITVCERWNSDFAAFLADMGPRPSPTHSINRINNDGNYEPSNCNWATPKEQSNNRRLPKKHPIHPNSLKNLRPRARLRHAPDDILFSE